MKKKIAVKSIQNSRQLLRALGNLTNETKIVEELFSDELHIFFQYLGRQILSEVDLNNPLEAVFYGHVTDTLNKYWVEYDKILSHYVDKAAIIGDVHYDILLEASKDKAKHFQATKAKNNERQFLDNELNVSENNELFAPNPKVSSRLKRKKFEASEKTRARVDKEINNILGEAYREGWGPRYVGDKIRQRFTDLSTYEARRIAQTEINTTRNYVQYQRMQDDEMEYKIWHAAHDSRTRKSHLKVDEEIVPINERFSNGLMYPGDKDGDPSEWVNCRCSHAAYIMPLGFEAPDFFPFTESDLVKVGSSLSKDYVSEIQERIRLIDGAMVREQEESNIEKPPVVEPVEVAPKPKKKPKQKSFLDEEPQISIERDEILKNNNTVYSFENGIEILINDSSQFSFEEIRDHLRSLPEPLRNLNPEVTKRIYIRGHRSPSMAGVFEPGFQRVQLFTGEDKSKRLDTLTHELAHAFDYNHSGKLFGKGGKFAASDIDVYSSIVEADNKLYAYTRPNGKIRIPNKFPTDYAGRSWLKYKKEYKKRLKLWEGGSKDPLLKPSDKRYVEDFAESSKLYLNKETHNQFVKEFPNRAKYLEELYGKPKFN